MINWVVDASVLFKSVVREDDSDKAISFLEKHDGFLAPDLIYAEIGNTLWKYEKAKSLMASDVMTIYENCFQAFETIVPMHELAAEALAISLDLNHSIYDCFYVALTVQCNGKLITADKKLFQTLKNSEFKNKVFLLADWE